MSCSRKGFAVALVNLEDTAFNHDATSLDTICTQIYIYYLEQLHDDVIVSSCQWQVQKE